MAGFVRLRLVVGMNDNTCSIMPTTFIGLAEIFASAGDDQKIALGTYRESMKVHGDSVMFWKYQFIWFGDRAKELLLKLKSSNGQVGLPFGMYESGTLWLVL